MSCQKKSPKQQTKNPQTQSHFDLSKSGMSVSGVRHSIHFEILGNMIIKSKYILSLTEYHIFFIIISIQKIEILNGNIYICSQRKREIFTSLDLFLRFWSWNQIDFLSLTSLFISLSYQWKGGKNPNSLSILLPSVCRLNQIYPTTSWLGVGGGKYLAILIFFVPDNGCPDGKWCYITARIVGGFVQAKNHSSLIFFQYLAFLNLNPIMTTTII